VAHFGQEIAPALHGSLGHIARTFQLLRTLLNALLQALIGFAKLQLLVMQHGLRLLAQGDVGHGNAHPSRSHQAIGARFLVLRHIQVHPKQALVGPDHLKLTFE